MKQVKKLLVILPLVALFVLGSLPVLATLPAPADVTVTYDGNKIEKDEQEVQLKEETAKFEPSLFKVMEGNEDKTKDYTAAPAAADKDGKVKVTVSYKDAQKANQEFSFVLVPATKAAEEIAPYTLIVKYYEDKECTKPAKEKIRRYGLDKTFFEKFKEYNYKNVSDLAESIKDFVMAQLQNGFKEVPGSFAAAAEKFIKGDDSATVNLYLPKAKTLKVIAYDIHSNRFVYDRLFELELNAGWNSPKDASEAFYNNTIDLQQRYLYAGFATEKIKPVIIYRGAYLEQIAENIYLKALSTYEADIVCFVVPRTIDVKTIHTFPEGTRDELIEYVPVPYEVWASLQHSWKFMDLPGVFKTRIQKVNELGFTYREVKYYNGLTEITGLVSGYDWFGFPVAGDGDYDFCARVFYDKAVAAAKEVPSEKKVDAATAPQAQIQAQGQAPVTAANTTTTTAPVNTLPVTGASDSIFLFLSSAALMAVGILFFKKH